MQKYVIIETTISGMECLQVINLNNTIVDVAFYNTANQNIMYNELASKYNVK